MASKAERLRRKKRASLDELCAVPSVARREKQARQNGRFTKVEEDPRAAFLNARCRRFGIDQTDENRSRMAGVHLCCDLGFVLEAACKPADIAPLWDVFSRWCRAEAVYRARYVGQREQPASAALTMVPETMETDPSLTVDVRSQDERDRDAVSGWMRWQGFFGHLPAQHRTVLHNARRQDGPVLWSGAATEAGLLALEALRGLAEAEGRRGVS